jgi:hypothetical protein
MKVERLTGLRRDQVSREFNSDAVQQVAKAYSWRLAAAKDIGKAGRMKYLVNDPLWNPELIRKAG